MADKQWAMNDDGEPKDVEAFRRIQQIESFFGKFVRIYDSARQEIAFGRVVGWRIDNNYRWPNAKYTGAYMIVFDGWEWPWVQTPWDYYIRELKADD